MNYHTFIIMFKGKGKGNFFSTLKLDLNYYLIKFTDYLIKLDLKQFLLNIFIS